VVVLHGFNVVNKLPPYQPAAWGFGADDARFLAENGFNTVRLGVIWKGLEPQPGEIDEAYLAQTVATARELAREGIFVLLDFHQDMYNERFNGEGMPDWATVDDGLPAEPDVGFPGNYLLMPALWRAFDHLWLNDPGADGRPLQTALGHAWRRVAMRFRGEDRVLGYNLLNEPWPGSQHPSCLTPEGCPQFDAVLLTEFSKRIIAAIREADPRTLVWYAPNLTFDFGARTWHGDTGDDRAGFAFNNYCLGGDPLQGGESERVACGTSEQRVFDLADDHSAATGDALLMTEFAATDDLPTVERVVDAADRNMVSWQQWAYWNQIGRAHV
jgi:endoglycosylceramidase